MREDLDNIDDNEFEELFAELNKSIINYIKSNFLCDYIAFYIAERVKHNALFTQSFENIVNSALYDLSQCTFEDCDEKKINKILNKKHDLIILNEENMEIGTTTQHKY